MTEPARRSPLVRSLDRAAALLRAVVPAPVWNRITAPYRDWRFARSSRQHWLTRRDDADGHVAMYWGTIDHPNRRVLVDVLARVIGDYDPSVAVRVLEFGCHAGMNFKLLHDRLSSRRLELYGVEPNHDAVAFAQRKLPFVKLLEAEDRAFVDGAFPSSAGVHVSFTNVVLYTVRAERAKAVIEKLCRTSEVVVLGEQLANTGSTSRFQQDPELYVHPYESWLRALGFRVIEIVPVPEPRPQQSGFLIARRAT